MGLSQQINFKPKPQSSGSDIYWSKVTENKFYDPLEYLSSHKRSKFYEQQQAYYNQAAYSKRWQELSNDWQPTRRPCPTCGAGMLVQVQSHLYWCATCCQKYAAEELANKKLSVLEWLDQQVAKYIK